VAKEKEMSIRWETPQAFFDMLNKDFHFTLDVAALPGTAKCKKYFTPEVNGLKQDWTQDVFFMNPPYGRGQDVYSWVKKAYEDGCNGVGGVCLLPVSGDTKWFHDFCMKANEIRFVRDRLWFSLDGKAQRANHASMVVVFSSVPSNTPSISAISNCREVKSFGDYLKLTDDEKLKALNENRQLDSPT
jgi:site-specific DNA-methyltransferase (adenine-specific)